MRTTLGIKIRGSVPDIILNNNNNNKHAYAGTTE
jgi:hypothetical protein